MIGGGLAGSEAALTLADFGFDVTLFEMRPVKETPVHRTDDLAELVCSNSLKSMNPDSAQGMLKKELETLSSFLYREALQCRVPAGGALAVDRSIFSKRITALIENDPRIDVVREEVDSIEDLIDGFDAIVLATGPLTSSNLIDSLKDLIEGNELAFFDAAAPIVMADSLDMDRIFSQSRYEDADDQADYLNAPFSKEEYEAFMDELTKAERVVKREFETDELFQACQPIEEIGRRGYDAPRFGPMKPVGLTDPNTGYRPWAVVQLRKEDANAQSYNLVGFQTNLTFPEQRRVFRMIPGFENAEFARYGVMHRNTFIDAPKNLDPFGKLITPAAKQKGIPIYIAGQLAGTEGYVEAIRSGLSCALAIAAELSDKQRVPLPNSTAFGALMSYATDPQTKDYQPMHVNFGIMPPIEPHIKNKKKRYAAYAERGQRALDDYMNELIEKGIIYEH